MSKPLSHNPYAASYRAILLAAMEQRCQRNPRYSQRAFARDMGVPPHRVSEILRGRQGMSRARAEQVAGRLDLDDRLARSFCDLVAAAHSRSGAERQAAIARLDLQTPKSQAKDTAVTKLATDRFKTISEWYHLAIIEALKLDGTDPTLSGLSARLGVATGQVRVAVERLVALGLIAPLPHGRYAAVKDSDIGGEVPSSAVRIFHEQHLAMAKDALLLQPFATRDANTLVLAVDRRRVPELKKRLVAFVEAINADFGLNAESGADAVYAMTLHAFRLDRDPPHSGTTQRENLI